MRLVKRRTIGRGNKEMSKAKEILDRIRQSKEFLQIIQESNLEKRYTAIRAITHSKPLLVFWISPSGEVLDAKNAHHDNPPKGDRSVLSDPGHKGHLRGRAAYIGDVIYILIYGRGKGSTDLSKQQLSLFRRSYPSLLLAIKDKNPNIPQEDIDSAQFITEIGEPILWGIYT